MHPRLVMSHERPDKSCTFPSGAGESTRSTGGLSEECAWVASVCRMSNCFRVCLPVCLFMSIYIFYVVVYQLDDLCTYPRICKYPP